MQSYAEQQELLKWQTGRLESSPHLRWADESDGVGEAAHDHLFSLWLKLCEVWTRNQLVRQIYVLTYFNGDDKGRTSSKELCPFFKVILCLGGQTVITASECLAAQTLTSRVLLTMLFHRPLASSSCPFMVKWKQSWVKKVMSIFPFCSGTKNIFCWFGFDLGERWPSSSADLSADVPTHRQAWRVGVFQEGLEHHGKVVLEESLAVQQLLESPLKTPTSRHNWTAGIQQQKAVEMLQHTRRQNCTWNSRLTSISSRSSGDLGNGSIRHGQKDLRQRHTQHKWKYA